MKTARIGAGGYDTTFYLSSVYRDEMAPYDFDVDAVTIYIDDYRKAYELSEEDAKIFTEFYYDYILERLIHENEVVFDVGESTFKFVFTVNDNANGKKGWNFEGYLVGYKDKTSAPLSRELCDNLLSVEPIESIFEAIANAKTIPAESIA